MFVVRRSFRNNSQMMAPGSVVEPGTIKRFKSRLNDGHIVEVSEQDFDKWDEYFKVRVGTPIRVPAVEPKPEPAPEPKPELEPELESEQPKAVKPAAKAQTAKSVVKPK